jgi:hypothetical protein
VDGGEGGETVTPPNCTPGIPGTSQIPRLTTEQYDRTIRDLLGVTGLTAHGNRQPSDLLAPTSSNPLTQRDWDGYMAAAEAIATQVMSDATLRGRFLPCTLTGDGTECLHEAIVSFGRRAFRRPLTDAEIARFDAIAAQGPLITESGSVDDVAQTILVTFLVSPSFLQRAEVSVARDADGHFVLSAHEVASRLSYVFWGTQPDSELDRAADAGELATVDQIRAQAERMLADPKARELVASFHRFYLKAGPGSRWEVAQKDPALFPLFTAAVVAAMNEETERFFDTIVFERAGSFQDLFTSTLGFVNADTAPLYGLDPAAFGSDLAEVSLDPAQRPGFLTRIGFLSAFADYSRTSPIARGTFVTRDVLGVNVGPDSPFPVDPPPIDPTLPTHRERLHQFTAPPECAGCHHIFLNPPGYVLEAFDAIGSWQTVEEDTGAPIDTVADVMIDDAAVTVSGPAELMAALAVSKQARRTYASRWLSYAYQRLEDPLDACSVDVLGQKLAEPGYTVLDLLLDLTGEGSFRLRSVEVDQ